VSSPPARAPGTELLLHHDVPARLSERIALAEASYQSNVVPAHLRSVAGQLNAQAAAIALRLPVWTVQQNMHLIEGRVGWDATFIRAMVRRAGHRIRITERTAERAEVTIWRSDEPDDPYTGEFTLQDAIDAELVAVDPKTGKPKRDNWRRYMKAMLVARATTIAVRECCPEVMLGNAYSPDELGGDVLDEEGAVIRLESERVVAKTTEVTDKAEAVRARWRVDIEGAADAEAVNRLYAQAQAQTFGDGTTLLDRPLYDDGTTVEAALAARIATLQADQVHDAEIVTDAVTDAEGVVHDAEVVDEEDGPRPVPDDPALCRNTPARAGVIAALRDGGDAEALVDVEYGLPIEQVSTRRLRELLIRVSHS
jgi:hypothetical protein